jgi:hypothetical protein
VGQPQATQRLLKDEEKRGWECGRLWPLQGHYTPWEQCLEVVTCILDWASLGMEHLDWQSRGLPPGAAEKQSDSLVPEGVHTLVLGQFFHVPGLSKAKRVSSSDSALA